MKRLPFAVCGLAFFTFSTAQSLFIYGDAAGWDASQGSMIEARANENELLGEGVIKADGSFEIEVAQPSSVWTMERQTTCREFTFVNNVQVSNPNAASSSIGLMVDRSDVNFLRLDNGRPHGEGSISASFEYFTEATTVIGTKECNDFETDLSTGFDMDDIHVYDIDAKAGWNFSVSRAEYNEATGMYTYYHSTESMEAYPQGVTWRTYDSFF